MSENLIDLIREAYKEFFIEFLSGSSQVEISDPSVRAKKHMFVNKQLEAWKESHSCIVEGCEARAIQKSHTIQKSGPLMHVAEKGMVLTPRFRIGQYGMAMREIPISRASTFPGFCSRHEQLFQHFEQRRQLSEERDFLLQSYRATCREVVRLQIEHAYFEANVSHFRRAQSEFVAVDLARRILASGKYITPLEIQQELDRLERPGPDPFDLRLQGALADLEKLRSAHLKDIEKALSGTSREEVIVSVTSLPMEIPVCLSGMDCINLPDGAGIRRLLIILNVIPEPGVTHIVAYLPREDRDLLAPYSELIDGLFSGLRMVEAAMLHSTDHWFLRPSVWRRIPKKRQNQILSEIMLRDGNATQETMHSVFDELRAELLDRLEASNPELVHEKTKQLILAHERKKLAGIDDAQGLWGL